MVRVRLAAANGRATSHCATLLADLWEEVDVHLPYSEGELLSRVRERGRVAPSLASELRAAAFGRRVLDRQA